MAEKRHLVDADPDYEDYNDGATNPQEKKRQRLAEIDGKGFTVKKIQSIVHREFQNEIHAKQIEIDQVDKLLQDARSMLDRLRACVVASYYSQAGLATVANQKSSLSAASIHPATKKFLGKTVPLDVKKEFPDNESEKCIMGNGGDAAKQQITDHLFVKGDKGQDGKTTLKKRSHTPSAGRAAWCKVKKRIVVGNVSRYIPLEKRDENDQATHKWMVYVRGPREEAQIHHFVEKVWFFLHPSYRPNDLVEINEWPFHLTRRGWGEFPVRVQLHFRDKRNKRVDIIHHLTLDRTYTGLQTLGSETVVDVELEKADSWMKSSITEGPSSSLLLNTGDQLKEDTNYSNILEKTVTENRPLEGAGEGFTICHNISPKKLVKDIRQLSLTYTELNTPDRSESSGFQDLSCNSTPESTTLSTSVRGSRCVSIDSLPSSVRGSRMSIDSLPSTPDSVNSSGKSHELSGSMSQGHRSKERPVNSGTTLDTSLHQSGKLKRKNTVEKSPGKKVQRLDIKEMVKTAIDGHVISTCTQAVISSSVSTSTPAVTSASLSTSTPAVTSASLCTSTPAVTSANLSTSMPAVTSDSLSTSTHTTTATTSVVRKSPDTSNKPAVKYIKLLDNKGRTILVPEHLLSQLQAGVGQKDLNLNISPTATMVPGKTQVPAANQLQPIRLNFQDKSLGDKSVIAMATSQNTKLSGVVQSVKSMERKKTTLPLAAGVKSGVDGSLSQGVVLQGPSQGVVLQGPSQGVVLQGPSQGVVLQGPSQGVVLQGGPSQGVVLQSGPNKLTQLQVQGTPSHSQTHTNKGKTVIQDTRSGLTLLSSGNTRLMMMSSQGSRLTNPTTSLLLPPSVRLNKPNTPVTMSQSSKFNTANTPIIVSQPSRFTTPSPKLITAKNVSKTSPNTLPQLVVKTPSGELKLVNSISPDGVLNVQHVSPLQIPAPVITESSPVVTPTGGKALIKDQVMSNVLTTQSGGTANTTVKSSSVKGHQGKATPTVRELLEAQRTNPMINPRVPAISLLRQVSPSTSNTQPLATKGNLRQPLIVGLKPGSTILQTGNSLLQPNSIIVQPGQVKSHQAMYKGNTTQNINLPQKLENYKETSCCVLTDTTTVSSTSLFQSKKVKSLLKSQVQLQQQQKDSPKLKQPQQDSTKLDKVLSLQPQNIPLHTAVKKKPVVLMRDTFKDMKTDMELTAAVSCTDDKNINTLNILRNSPDIQAMIQTNQSKVSTSSDSDQMHQSNDSLHQVPVTKTVMLNLVGGSDINVVYRSSDKPTWRELVQRQLQNQGPKRVHLPNYSIGDFHSVEDLVRTLIRHYPLVKEVPDRVLHPYCTSDRETFLRWNVGKRRAAELCRVATLRKAMVNILGGGDMLHSEVIWSKRRLILWCRRNGYTPLDTEISMNLRDEVQPLITETYSSYTGHESLLQRLYDQWSGEESLSNTMVTENDGQEHIDILTDDLIEQQQNQGKLKSPIKQQQRLEDIILPPGTGAHFIKETCSQIGVRLKPAVIGEESGATLRGHLVEELLYKASLRLAEDIVRKAFDVICTSNRLPGEISAHDVYEALNSLPHCDFLTNQKLGRMEQDSLDVHPS